MPRPGFYNDNEYRAYPFIYTGSADTSLPTSLIVDAGVVMGLDAEFDPASHSVWLSSIARINQMLTVEFATDAPGALEVPLQFTMTIADNVWQTGFAETRTADLTAVPCAAEPIWEGFLTTGALAADLDPYFIITFAANQHQLEPARIQNLAKSYLRSISVGNFARTTIPACDTLNNTNRPIVLNTECIQGDIRFREGYNCAITQTDRNREISIAATKGAGAGATGDELCEKSGELPLYTGEQLPLGPIKETTFIAAFDVHGQNPPTDEQLAGLLPATCAGNKTGDTYGWKSDLKQAPDVVPPLLYYDARYYTWNNISWMQSSIVRFNEIVSENVAAPAREFEDFPTHMPPDVQSVQAFLSGGPRCCELITTINGAGGRTLNIIGGTGVQIGTAPHKITVTLNTNSQNSCATP